MKNIINKEDLPKKQWHGKEVVDWEALNNTEVRFEYEEIVGVLYVTFIEKVNNSKMLKVSYKDNVKTVNNANFLKGKILSVIGKSKRFEGHRYKVGEVVNNVTVLKQTRKKDARNNNILSYEVKCNETGEIFSQTQYNMSYGYGSPYASGQKVWKGNWLYNEKHLLPLIKNVEDAKKHSINGDGKILCVCPNPNCKKEKYMIARVLYNYGVTCLNCGNGSSYPEKFIMAYLEVKNIEYIHQYKLKNQHKFIDFYIPSKNLFIEIHGLQHYRDTGFMNHEKTIKSDAVKRQYCKDKNIKLIELNASNSYFNFIKNSIENSLLENITEEEALKMKEIIVGKRLNKNELGILEDYKNKKSIPYIAEKYNVSFKHVTNIAKKYGEYQNRSREIKIKCLDDGNIYNSIAEASRATGISASSIGMVVSNKRKYCKDKSGNPSHWTKIEDSNYNNIINDIV